MFIKNKWGLNRKTFKKLARLHNKTFYPPHKTDDPERCTIGSLYWHTYPIKDYTYQYNSWGFRGEDYQQYAGHPVNICLGDSNTVNIGGPIEHSWPYQLSEYFDIPTLNFGVDGCAFYEFNELINKIKPIFNVKNIFVLYNLLDFDEEPINQVVLPVLNSSKIDTKIKIFKEHCWVHNAHWQFDPAWSFVNEELPCLYEHFPEAHDYFKFVNISWADLDYNSCMASNFLQSEYNKIKGTDWPTFDNFIKIIIVNHRELWKIFTKKIDINLINQYMTIHLSALLLRNRDYWHMSYHLNKALAKYFYQKSLVQN